MDVPPVKKARRMYPRVLAANDKEKCMYRGCKMKGYARRACTRHGDQMRRAVKRNLTSWVELEEMGYCRPLTNVHASSQELLDSIIAHRSKK